MQNTPDIAAWAVSDTLDRRRSLGQGRLGQHGLNAVDSKDIAIWHSQGCAQRVDFTGGKSHVQDQGGPDDPAHGSLFGRIGAVVYQPTTPMRPGSGIFSLANASS